MLKKIKGYFASFYEFEGATKQDKWLFWFAIGILAFSLIPRFVTIDWFLPIYSIDENELVEFSIGYFGGDMDPHWYKYGAFYGYILHYVYNLQIMFSSMSEEEFVQSVFVDCRHLYYTARFINSFLHLLMAFVTYEIAKQLFSKRTALIVFAIACFPLLGLLTNFTIRVDTLLAFWSTCAIYYVVKMAKEGKMKHYLLAGLFVGFGIASKPLPGILILPTVFFGHLMGYLSLVKAEKKNFNYYLGLVVNPKILALPVAAFVANFIGNPYSILNFDGFWKETEKIIKEEGGYNFIVGWDVTRFFNSLGYVFTILAFGLVFYAIYRGIKKKDWVSLLPLSYAIIFWSIFSLGAARNYFYIPIFLVLATYIGVAINDLAVRLTKLDEVKRVGLIMVSIVIMLAQPTYVVFTKVLPKSFVDVETEYTVLAAKKYLEDNVNGKASVVFAGFYTSQPRVVLGEIGNYGLAGRKLNANVWGDYFMYGRGNNKYFIEQFQKWHTGYLASGEPRFDNAVYFKLMKKEQVLDILFNSKAQYLVTTTHLNLDEDAFFKDKVVKRFEAGVDGVKQGGTITVYEVNGAEPVKMLCAEPETAYDYYWNSIVYTRIGKNEEAMTALKKVIEIDPEHKGAQVAFGNISLNKGDFKGAIEAYKKVVEQDPADLQTLANLSRAYYFNKEYKLSIEGYDQILEKKADYADAYLMNVQSYLALGDTVSVLKELDKGIKAVPSASNIQSQKANILQMKGDFKEALVCFRKAYALNAGDVQSITAAYTIATRLGDASGMITDITAFINAQPTNGQLYLTRGNLFERLGNKDKACTDYAKAQELGNPQAISFRSRLCF